MKINELDIGQRVSIMATINDASYNFDTTVYDKLQKGNFILLHAVYSNGKPIFFNGVGVSVSLIVFKQLAEGSLSIFRDVSIRLLRKDDGYYILASTDSESEPFNRRSGFRCLINLESTASFGPFHTTDVMIKDISTTGFALITKNAVPDITTGCPVSTTLVDLLLDNSLREFDLSGSVVRIMPLDDGSVLYGCILGYPVAGLENYIITKEKLRTSVN